MPAGSSISTRPSRSRSTTAAQAPPILRTELGGTMIARHEDVEFVAERRRVLVRHGRDLDRQRATTHPAADQPARAREVPRCSTRCSPRSRSLLENDVRKLSNQLIDDFIDKGECEFNRRSPLPCTVFLRLGLQLEDLDLFWS
jgi:hypothetical protein